MSFWSGRRVLVTGANGFTGSHLCRHLLRSGAAVKGLVKPEGNLENLRDLQGEVEISHASITDFEALLKIFRGVDYSFHPAAVVPLVDAWASPVEAVQVNSTGAYLVASACMKAGVKKLVHVSTCHIYGNQPVSQMPIRETHPAHPMEVYAASKYAGEILVQSIGAQGFPVVISRAFAKFGPAQTPQFLIPRIISQMIHGGEVKLGDPRPTRDYSYIDDMVSGYMLMMEKGKAGEIYHLSSEKECSVEEVYERIARICGGNGRVIWNQVHRGYDTFRQVGDSSKARKELGWGPKVSFEEGLRLTVEWWRERITAQAPA